MMDFVEFIGDGKPVEIRYRLYDTVRYDIYEYMIGWSSIDDDASDDEERYG